MKIGDVVVLKSGGPDMTIVTVSGDDVVARWHLGPNLSYGTDTFHRGTLVNKTEDERVEAAAAKAAEAKTKAKAK